MKKRAFITFLYLLLIGAASFIAPMRTDGFSLAKILSDFSPDPLWNTPKLSQGRMQEILAILDQKFTYLEKGKQCYLFTSEDGKYLIKFLNHEQSFLPKAIRNAPLPAFLETIRSEQRVKKRSRIAAFFKSFHIGYLRLKEETGMIFLQLNRSGVFTKPLLLVDKMGYEHKLNLNEVEFLLQKKADRFYPTLERLAGDREAFQKALDSYLDLIICRLNKDIADDLNVAINVGYLEGHAILMDTGRLFLDPSLKRPERFSGELLKATQYLHTYLAENYPEMVSYLDLELQKKIESYRKVFFANLNPTL